MFTMNLRPLVFLLVPGAAFLASCGPRQDEPTAARADPDGDIVDVEPTRRVAKKQNKATVICSYYHDFSEPPSDWSDGACVVDWCDTPRTSSRNGCNTPSGALSVGIGDSGSVVVRCGIAKTGATSIRITFRYSQFSEVKDLAPFWLGFKQSDKELDDCPDNIADLVALNKTWAPGELPTCFDGGITMPVNDDTHEVYWRWIRHDSEVGQQGALVDDLTIEWLLED